MRVPHPLGQPPPGEARTDGVTPHPPGLPAPGPAPADGAPSQGRPVPPPGGASVPPTWQGKVLPEMCSMGGWWTVEARNGHGACGQSNLMWLACWLAAGQGLCERDLPVCSRGRNRRASLETGFYCLAARTTTSRLRTPFILEVVMYDPYEGLAASVMHAKQAVPIVQ